MKIIEKITVSKIPLNCKDCQFNNIYNQTMYCQLNDRDIKGKDRYSGRPYWCQLKIVNKKPK